MTSDSETTEAIPRAGSREAVLESLQQAAVTVAELCAGRSMCLPAAALMVVTGRHLGVQLQPRLVSFLGRNRATKTVVVSGDLAAQTAGYTSAEVRRHAERVSNFGIGWAGHAVVTSASEHLLIDANFGQFHEGGFPNTALVTPIQDGDPPAGEWLVDISPSLEIRYLLDNRQAQSHLAGIEERAEVWQWAGQLLGDTPALMATPQHDEWVDQFRRRLAACRPGRLDAAPGKAARQCCRR